MFKQTSSPGLRPGARLVLPLITLMLGGCSSVEPTPNTADGIPELARPALGTLSQQAGLSADQSLVLLRSSSGPAGLSHVHVRQQVSGVPVWGGEAIVHIDEAGQLRATTDKLLRDISVDVHPTLDVVEAELVARDAEGLMSDLPAETQLFVLRHQGRDHLVWRVQLARMDEAPTRPVVFVDAHSGRVVFRYENLQTGAAEGTGTGTWSGTVALSTWQSERGYVLEDVDRGLGLCTQTYKSRTARPTRNLDMDNAWIATPQSDAVEVHANLAATYDTFLESFGRDGADGAGGPGLAPSATGEGRCLSAFTDYGNRYVNAFWDGKAVYFGDGDGSSSDPLTSPDIVGHELAHGVTAFTANLAYYGESGGLNEAMSDIFGALVEARVRGEDNPGLWQVGEEVWTPGTDGDALRWMNDPTQDGYSLDLWSRSAGSADVHYSSGIANLSFYLLSEGGTHPRLGGDEMVGIGMESAGAIFYTALSGYMTAETDFGEAREATIPAAEDLYGADSVEVQAVQAAWTLVGVEAG